MKRGELRVESKHVIVYLPLVYVQGALWHIYSASDADKIRALLRKVRTYVHGFTGYYFLLPMHVPPTTHLLQCSIETEL